MIGVDRGGAARRWVKVLGLWWASVAGLGISLAPAVSSADWTRQVLDTAGMVGGAVDLKADRTGAIRLSYRNLNQDVTDRQLRFAEIVPSSSTPTTGWTIEIVDRHGGGDTALVVDGSWSPHIRYLDRESGLLRSAVRTGAEWDVKPLSVPGVWEYHVASALDRDGIEAFTAYQRCAIGPEFCAAPGPLYTAQLVLFTAGGAVGRVIAPVGGQAGKDNPEYGKWNAISGDPVRSSTYRVAYQVIDALHATQNVAYAVWGPTGPLDLEYKEFEPNGSVGTLGSAVQLEVDQQGQPHLAYLTNKGEITYRWKQNGDWHVDSLAAGESAESLSLVLDGAGNPHLAYFDRASHGIRYLTTMDLLTAPAPTWTDETVASAVTEPPNTSTRFISIGLAGGHPVVAFYAESIASAPTGARDLWMAYRDLPDGDSDGIPDMYDRAPNNGDENGDGVPDGWNGTVHTVIDQAPPSGGSGPPRPPSTPPPASTTSTDPNLASGFFGCGAVRAVQTRAGFGGMAELALIALWRMVAMCRRLWWPGRRRGGP